MKPRRVLITRTSSTSLHFSTTAVLLSIHNTNPRDSFLLARLCTGISTLVMTMADPFSITVGAIGVVAGTVRGIRELIDFINEIKDAPDTLRQLGAELINVEAVLTSLEKTLESDGESASWRNLLENSKLKGALKLLRSNCNTYRAALQGWTKRSGAGDKLSFRDSVNLAVHKGKIEAMQTQLDRCKQTVTMALSCCTLQSQIQNMQSKETDKTALVSQEENATKLFNDLRIDIAGLVSKENDLKLVRQRTEDDGDIEEMEMVENELQDISRTRIALSQLETVSKFVAKTLVATRTGQSIGIVIIADEGYGSVGMTNVEGFSEVRQTIGDVGVGKAATGFVGIHNNVDHSALLANRWGSSNRP